MVKPCAALTSAIQQVCGVKPCCRFIHLVISEYVAIAISG